jgi:hypothetical protein
MITEQRKIREYLDGLNPRERVTIAHNDKLKGKDYLHIIGNIGRERSTVLTHFLNEDDEAYPDITVHSLDPRSIESVSGNTISLHAGSPLRSDIAPYGTMISIYATQARFLAKGVAA